MIENFCKYCVLQGGELFPINVSAEDSARLGICNPSIFDDGDKIYISLRNVNYMLFNNKNKKYQTFFGEGVYATPDDDLHLRTRNYLAEYDLETNSIKSYNLIDTSDFDIEPKWDFIGLEDVRLVRWNNKLYATGCRRDVKENGESRMELSEIDPKTGKELSRVRINAPGDNTSYCEKNWVPVLDMPFHYIKWTNPTELVKVNPETGECQSLFVKEQNQDILKTNRALRGSSQIIPFGNGYIALMHEVDLSQTELKRKDCRYYMKWIMFDKEFNITHASDEFNFLNFDIEFTNGLMYKDNYFYIPFAVMDNISFLLKVEKNIVCNFIMDYKPDERFDYVTLKDNTSLYNQICLNSDDPELWFELGEQLITEGQQTEAGVCYARALEEGGKTLDDTYKYAYMLATAFSGIGHRDYIELSLWENCINIDSSRSEAYENISRYHRWRNNLHSAYTYAKIAYELNNFVYMSPNSTVDNLITEIHYYELMYYSYIIGESIIHLEQLKNNLLKYGEQYNYYINIISSILEGFQENVKNIKKLI